MISKIKKEFHEVGLLLKSIPATILTFFVLSVVLMNILANKSINLPVSWLALDAGIVVSWIAFLTMDIITKHFGPKAATEISIFAVLINLICCLLFFIVSVIPGIWSESYVTGSEDIINGALNNTFRGTWYILFGSTVAFILSAIVNNFTNWGIGKVFKKKKDGFLVYALRTYVSTMLGQFVDNLTFAFIVSYVFFGWSVVQCFTCALTGMIVELLCEVVFSHLGYRITKKWKSENIGELYFAFIEEKRLEK